MQALPELGFLAIVALIFLVSAPLELRKRKKLRNAAMSQLKSTKLTSTVDQYTFNGATAKLIKQEESSFNERNGPYVLTVYAMNEYGEYFMFRSNSPTPYIKHMTQSMAKVILKEKYIPPNGSRLTEDKN